MAATHVQSLSNLAKTIYRNPERYNLFHAFYLLDHAGMQVKFAINPKLKFYSQDIHAITTSSNNKGISLTLITNLLALIGSEGILPAHYTEDVVSASHANNQGLIQFYNLLHQRLLTLAYKTWKSQQFYLPNKTKQTNQITQALQAISGQPAMDNDTAISLNFAAFTNKPTRTTFFLQQIIQQTFNINASIVELTGKWQQLASDKTPNKLGSNAMLGDRVWLSQASFTVVLGPLSREDYLRFLPSKPALKSLQKIIKDYSGFSTTFNIELLLDEQAKQKTALTQSDDVKLGWTSWLLPDINKPITENLTI